jgi:transcriptional regulator with XRE-family HTH domain
MELNERIEHLRTLAGMTQKFFALELGVSVTALQKYENGSKPGFDVCKNLFRIFPSLNPWWLFHGTGPVFVIYIQAYENFDYLSGPNFKN